MSVVDITFPGNISQVATAALLRTVPSAFIKGDDLYYVPEVKAIFGWDGSSLANDDGTTVLRPNDITPLQMGRWVLAIGKGSPATNALQVSTDDDFVGAFYTTVQGLADRTRIRLAADLHIYVRTDGSDSNTGLADSAAGSKLTWQAAFDLAASFDLNGFNIIVAAGAQSGVRTWNFSEIQVRQLVGKGRLYVRGNGDNTVLNASGQCFSLYDTLAPIYFGSVKLISGGGYGTIVVNGASSIGFDDVNAIGPNFGGAASGSHIFVHDNGAVASLLNAAYKITGGAPDAHIWCAGNGSASHEGNTITVTGAPTIANWYATVSGGYLQAFNNTVVGSFTGRKYYAAAGGILNTLNQAESVIPGTAGLLSSGGILQTSAGAFKTDALTVATINGNSITSPGIYSPTVTAVSGSFAITPTASLTYSVQNGVVTVSGTVNVAASGVGTATGGILITPPVTSNSAGAGDVFNTTSGASMPCVYNLGGDQKIRIVGNPTNSTYYTLSISWHA